MQSLLNLILNATPEERKELQSALHVAEQISQAEKRYEDAPKTDFYERVRAASLLNKFAAALRADLKKDPCYHRIDRFVQGLSSAASSQRFSQWVHQRSWGIGLAPLTTSDMIMESSWEELKHFFAQIVKDLPLTSLMSLVDILHEEGSGTVARRYSVEMTEDKTGINFTIPGSTPLLLYTLPQ